MHSDFGCFAFLLLSELSMVCERYVSSFPFVCYHNHVVVIPQSDLYAYGVIYVTFTRIWYLHIISISCWAFVQIIVSLPMDLYARALLQRKTPIFLAPRKEGRNQELEALL